MSMNGRLNIYSHWRAYVVVLLSQYDSAKHRLSQALQLADVATTKARLASLQNDASSDNIWDDPPRAQGLLSEISALKDELAQIDKWVPWCDAVECHGVQCSGVAGVMNISRTHWAVKT